MSDWLEDLTAEQLLQTAGLMNRFTTQMAHLKMMNASGSAFRSHPQCYWGNGILITNHWHTYRSDDIYVASDRNAKIIPGCQDSRAYGNPYPSVDAGHLECVWSGEWKKRGPWEQPITDLLADLIERVRSRIKADTDAAEQKQAEHKKEQADRNAELLSAWK